MSTKISWNLIAPYLFCFLPLAWSGCPFQNPFYFVDRPSVVTVIDSEGEMVPNRVRVSWGLLENFICVDYFQIECYELGDMVGTMERSGKINRHRRSYDIEIKPCTNYVFKYIASEDWNGMREDFRMGSETISFRVDYTPKFKKPPVVKERRIRVPRQSRKSLPKRKRHMLENDVKTPEPAQFVPFNVWVSWKLSDIDWPMCLAYFEFDYYDTVYNDSSLLIPIQAPFHRRIEFELGSQKIPCNQEYAFIVRVYGKTGEHSLDYWTPPSCMAATPEPTTTTPAPTTLLEEGALARALEKNKALKETITGLKQQYSPIGQRVYKAIKESIFHSFEAYLAKEKILEGGDIVKIQKLAENPEDPFSII